MDEEINKEFDEFQKVLEEKEKHLKMEVSFDIDEKLENELKELKEKEVIL